MRTRIGTEKDGTPLYQDEDGYVWFGCGPVAILDETDAPVADPAVAPAAPAEEPKEEKSALDDAKDAAEPKDENGGVKPPEDGQCRECKRLRRLNRLRLCYPCWVELNIMDEMKKRGQTWKAGDKHPDWCGCHGLGEHVNEDGGARGFN